jgi:ribosomal protein S3
MGKKVNPSAMRPDFQKCQWFTSNKKDYAKNILQDFLIRELAGKIINSRLFSHLSIKRVYDQNDAIKTEITIHTHKPGMLAGTPKVILPRSIGQVKPKGIKRREKRERKIEQYNKIPLIERFKMALREKIFPPVIISPLIVKNITQTLPETTFLPSFQVLIVEVLHPELNAIIIANNMAEQIENRVSVKSVMKKHSSYFKRMCAEGGIKITCSGRIGGAEIARKEKIQLGKMPLTSIKEYVEKAIAVAHTVYGTVSIQILIYIPAHFSVHFANRYSNNNKYSNRFNNDRTKTDHQLSSVFSENNKVEQVNELNTIKTQGDNNVNATQNN